MKRYIISTWEKGLSVYTQYLPYPVPYLSCHNKSTILMPVSSNSRVAKFTRNKYKKSFGCFIYTISQESRKKTQNTCTNTRKKLCTKHPNYLLFLLVSLHLLYSKLFHLPQLRTHTRATQAPTAETKNQRRERTSSLPLLGGVTMRQAGQRCQLFTTTISERNMWSPSIQYTCNPHLVLNWPQC